VVRRSPHSTAAPRAATTATAMKKRRPGLTGTHPSALSLASIGLASEGAEDSWRLGVACSFPLPDLGRARGEPLHEAPELAQRAHKTLELAGRRPGVRGALHSPAARISNPGVREAHQPQTARHDRA
jgi:hypothetical protein